MNLTDIAFAKQMLGSGGGGGGSAKIIELNATITGDSITIDGDLPSWEEITSTFNSCGYIVLHNALLGSIVLKSDYSTPNGNRHFTSTMMVNGDVTYKCYLELYLDNDDDVAYLGHIYESSPLIVTLTPVNVDYSGDMDKTPEEITTAVAQGRDIVFSIPTMDAVVKATQIDNSGQYTRVAANIVYNISGTDVLMQIVTSDIVSAYSVNIFPLTPMSI